MKVGAVIVSAGKGRRLAKGDKAVLKLAGKPLFCRSLFCFEGIKAVKEIVLVLRKENFSLAARYIKGKKVTLAEGGSKRADSVFNGLSALSKDVEYVLVHDAARPFVSRPLVFKVLKELKRHPAVICGLKCPDTIKLVRRNFVKKTLDREGVYLIQTPQGFKKSVLLQACKKLRKKKETVPLEIAGKKRKIKNLSAALTDDARILESAGKRVKVIPGDLLNFKITYPEDLKLARIICDERL